MLDPASKATGTPPTGDTALANLASTWTSGQKATWSSWLYSAQHAKGAVGAQRDEFLLPGSASEWRILCACRQSTSIIPHLQGARSHSNANSHSPSPASQLLDGGAKGASHRRMRQSRRKPKTWKPPGHSQWRPCCRRNLRAVVPGRRRYFCFGGLHIVLLLLEQVLRKVLLHGQSLSKTPTSSISGPVWVIDRCFGQLTVLSM